MAEGRGRRVATGFLVVWLVFWSAGMLVVLYGLALALRSGDGFGIALMALWLAAAGFGLWQGLRKLRALAGGPAAVRRSARSHRWRDAEPPEPPEA